MAFENSYLKMKIPIIISILNYTLIFTFSGILKLQPITNQFNMCNLFFPVSILFCLLTSIGAFGQKTHIVSSSIRQVTVYRDGAEITRDLTVSLEEGVHELIVKGLSSSLDKESIRLSGLGDLTVLSIFARGDYHQQGEKSKTITSLENKRTQFTEKLTFERGMEQIYKQEEEMLIKNQQIGGTSGTKMLELKEAVEFQRKRMVEILQRKLETANNIKRWDDSLKWIGKELSPLMTESRKATTEVAVRVSVKKPAQVKLDLSYYIANAGWYPAYDAKLTDLAAPIALQFKAGVFQYSGEDWNKVKITLSSANPRDKSVSPELKTWYWGAPNNYSSYATISSDNLPVAGDVTEVSGFVRDEQNDPLPGVTVTIKAANIGANTDMNGFYRVSVPVNLPAAQRLLDFSFIGYVTQSKTISDSKMDVNLKPDNMALGEVTVVGYGEQRARGLSGAVAGIIVNKREAIRLNTNERDAPTSVTYEIPVAYTLPSDGKTYTVDLKSENIGDSYYEYVSIPKVRQEVFLNAYLPSWTGLNLLPGDVNLYLENSYIGKTRLDPAVASDTLSLSFGVDKSVTVLREQVKTFIKKQFLGNNTTETRAYRIVLRNTKKVPVRIVVRDQFPLAKSREVEIFDKSAPEAKVDETTGEFTWTVVLPGGESKELSFRYSVKYPKAGYVTRE